MSPATRRNLLAALAIMMICVAAAVAAHAAAPLLWRWARLRGNVPGKISFARAAILQAAVFFIGFISARWWKPLSATAMRRWRPLWTAVSLIGLSIAIACGVVWAGLHQFAGYDYNIVLEVGWREFLGQRQFTDFVASSPPGFGIPLHLAFWLMGPSWYSVLALTATFAVLTFIWSFALLQSLSLHPLAALLTAASVQTGTTILLGFWWYNNTAILTAAIFFLAALAFAAGRINLFTQASLVLSLSMLLLMKPNISGLVIAGSIGIVLLFSKHRARFLLLCACGIALGLGIAAVTHTSLPGMVAAYRGASRERGVISSFGFQNLEPAYKALSIAGVLALCLPLLSLRRNAAERAGGRQRLLYPLFFVLALIIAVFCIRTNGELPQVDWPLMILAGAVLLAMFDRAGSRVTTVYIALLASFVASDIYQTSARSRVLTTGEHVFFEWTDADHRIPDGFLRGMYVSGTFVRTEDDVKRAVRNNPGPVYFGPRIDFNYAVLGIPSPLHLAAWWHPGTAFARADVPRLIAEWERYHFATLVFLKDDYQYYSPEFLARIHAEYAEDDSYPTITVYHRK